MSEDQNAMNGSKLTYINKFIKLFHINTFSKRKNFDQMLLFLKSIPDDSLL